MGKEESSLIITGLRVAIVTASLQDTGTNNRKANLKLTSKMAERHDTTYDTIYYTVPVMHQVVHHDIGHYAQALHVFSNCIVSTEHGLYWLILKKSSGSAAEVSTTQFLSDKNAQLTISFFHLVRTKTGGINSFDAPTLGGSEDVGVAMGMLAGETVRKTRPAQEKTDGRG
ncbi:hypothetical protein BJV78DRAFT_1151485 [Lactifluus subvellereus]|nr:hypothetical protein BJV78DRAFT_1151485 [Lactifluus subvellereus]